MTSAGRIWISPIIGIVMCDALLFLGGYYGRLVVTNLIFIRLLCIIAMIASVVLLSYAGLKERRPGMAGLAALLSLFVCSFVLGTWGPRAPFLLGAETRIRKDLNKIELHRWVQTVVADNAIIDDAFIPPKDIPKFVKIAHWPLLGAIVRNGKGYRYVDVVWGSGFAGTYRLSVVPENVTFDYGKFLAPGIYFYASSGSLVGTF